MQELLVDVGVRGAYRCLLGIAITGVVSCVSGVKIPRLSMANKYVPTGASIPQEERSEVTV